MAAANAFQFGLAQSGDAFQEDVAFGEEPHQRLANQLGWRRCAWPTASSMLRPGRVSFDPVHLAHLRCESVPK